MTYSEKKRKSEYGGTMVESFFCMLMVCLILFGLLQIFHWSVAKILCEYSAFYAVKGHALGYKRDIIRRGGRVAMMGASGEDLSTNPVSSPYNKWELERQARSAMLMGNSGVDFEYWDDNETSSSDIPRIRVWSDPDSDLNFYARVYIDKMPILDESLLQFIDQEHSSIISEKAKMHKYSQYYLEESL